MKNKQCFLETCCPYIIHKRQVTVCKDNCIPSSLLQLSQLKIVCHGWQRNETIVSLWSLWEKEKEINWRRTWQPTPVFLPAILSTINYKRNRALPLKSVICSPVATGFSYQWVRNAALQHNPIRWKIYLLTRFRWFIHSLTLEKHWNRGDGSIGEVVKERGLGWWCWLRPEAYPLGCQYRVHWLVYKGQTQ